MHSLHSENTIISKSSRIEINQLVLGKRQTPVIIIDEANYIENAVLNDLKMLFNFEILNVSNGTPRMINKLYNASLLVDNSSNLNTIVMIIVNSSIRLGSQFLIF